MDIGNILATVEDHDENIVEFDEVDNIIEEAFDDLDMEDRYEEELYSESFEMQMDILLERSKEVTEGKYTLEDAIRLEKNFEQFVDEETDADVTDVAVADQVEVLRMRKVFTLTDSLLNDYDVKEEAVKFEATEEDVEDEDLRNELNGIDFEDASIEDLLLLAMFEEEEDIGDEKTFSEEAEGESLGRRIKGKFIKDPPINKKPNILKRAVGKVKGKIAAYNKYVEGNLNKTDQMMAKKNRSDKLKEMAKGPFFQKVKGKIMALWDAIRKAYSKAGKWVSGTRVVTWVKDALAKGKSFWNTRLTGYGKAAAIAAAAVAFMASVLLLARKMRKYSVNADKQQASLSKLGGEFNGDKSARILSKKELNDMISACKSTLKSAEKAAGTEVDSVDDAKSKFNSANLTTLGISVNKRGKAKFGRKSRKKASLSEHGYSAGDFARLKKEHKDISMMMTETANTIAKNGNPAGGKGMRTIVQTADKAYRMTMVNIFAAAKALG